MKQSLSIILAGGLIAAAIIANGYFVDKKHQDEVQRCMNLVGQGNIQKDTTQYEAIWYQCAKSLK